VNRQILFKNYHLKINQVIQRKAVMVHKKLLMSFMFLCLSVPAGAQETRLKDLVNIRGVRSNHLIGFGLVVGLTGSGDSKKSLATNRATANMLTRLGLNTGSAEVAGGNVAAVIATVSLPAFSRIGDKLDIKVSTIGDAKSLAGGTLLLTPLKAGDSNIYIVAQGSVVVGQANGQGPRVLTVARVPSGGMVEREFVPEIAPTGRISLSLKMPDFTTASRIGDSINRRFKGFFAIAKDVSTVDVVVPPLYQNKLVKFVAEMEALKVVPDSKAKVVLNERTGTVVMGSGVVILPVTIAHGDLSIRVGGKKKKNADKSVVNMGGSTVGDLIETMNALGVKPADLVGILQSMHASGALQAEITFL
jgi:flagellar P-ring protein FlgI